MTSQAASPAVRRVLAASILIGLLAEQTVMFAVPLIVYQNTGNIAYSGAAFALEWLPALLAYPFAGVLADRCGGRRLLERANQLRAACLFLATTICFLAPSLAVWVLMTNGALLSLLVAPVRMAVEKTVPQVAEGERLAHVQSLVQNMELLAMAVGPAIAAFAATMIGKTALLGLAALAFAAAATCARALPPLARVAAAARAQGVLEELALGCRLLLDNRPVVLLALLNFLINLTFAATLSANAVVVTGTFGAPDAAFGLMNAGAGVIGAANLLLIPRFLAVMSIGQLGAVGFAVLSSGMLCLGLAPTFACYALAFWSAETGCALFNVFNRTQRVKVIERDHLGKIMGPFYLVNLLPLPLGGLLIAGLGGEYGAQRIILVLALVLAVAGSALLWLTARRFRERLVAIEYRQGAQA